MKWAVEIQKTGLEHHNLVDLLDGLGFKLVDGVDSKVMYASFFDNFETANEVWEEAKKVRNAFTGPASIDSKFALGSVIDYSTKDRKRHAFLEVNSLRSKTTFGSVTLTVSPPASLSPEEQKNGKRIALNMIIKTNLNASEKNSNLLFLREEHLKY